MKTLFSDLVKRFERENIRVLLEFGEGMPYDQKIAKIARNDERLFGRWGEWG